MELAKVADTSTVYGLCRTRVDVFLTIMNAVTERSATNGYTVFVL
jgi:hypothetical protein